MDTQFFKRLLSGIVATKTISSENPAESQSNMELVKFLEKESQSLGGICIEQPVLSDPHKNNLLVRFGPDVPGGLLLSGHTDTVGCSPELWSSDPFKLHESEDRFAGLGVIDMKGFFAHALAALKDVGTQNLSKPLWLLATVDEETSMRGAIAAAPFAKTRGVRPDAALIGEPTSLVPVFQHKGYLAYTIAIEGEACHSSNPDAGVNAIEIASGVLKEIFALRDALKTAYRDDAFAVPYPTLNVGAIRGGDSTNRVCDCCEFDLDMRPIASSPVADLEKMLKDAAAKGAGNNADRVCVSEQYAGIPPFRTAKDNEFIRTLEELSGNHATAVAYCTEASFLAELGCPLAVMGAGDIANAHSINEWLPKDEIEKLNGILKALIEKYCV